MRKRMLNSNLIKCDKGWERFKSDWPHKEDINEPNRIEIKQQAGVSLINPN